MKKRNITAEVFDESGLTILTINFIGEYSMNSCFTAVHSFLDSFLEPATYVVWSVEGVD